MTNSDKILKRYQITEDVTSAIMVLATAITLCLIYMQTQKQQSKFRIVYAIMGLNFLAWFMDFISSFAKSGWLIGLCT